TAVDFVLVFLFSWLVFPSLKGGEKLVEFFQLDVPNLPNDERALNFFFACALAFIFSNLVAYVTNFVWVFKPGRHGRKKEIILFYTISLISFGVGTALGSGLINAFGWGLMAATLSKIFVSVMINYAGRKFIVFKG
ncbi:MAG: GtrA family protein, partial [Verrucomicrobiota bacterium]